MLCQRLTIIHHLPMQSVLWIIMSGIIALALSNCTNTNSGDAPQSTTGPFDRTGRYIEEWADNPSKWRKGSADPSPHELNSDEIPEIAKSEQPPLDSNPLASATPSKSPLSFFTKKAPSKTKLADATPASVPVVVASKAESKPEAKPDTKPESTVKSKATPKPVAKAKPKSQSKRYLVKNGDSLSLIASRTGSSVSAIKRANGISGTLIRAGQTLTIPGK
jgi:LysM repeat protein